MTVTRIFQSGFDLQHSSEVDHYTTAYGNSLFAVSTSAGTMKTGAASAQITTGNYPFGKAFSSKTQIRSSFFFRHNGTIGTANYTFVAFMTGTYEIIIGKNLATGNLDLVVNGVIRASVSFSTALPLLNTFYAVGVAAKADASTGFLSVYVDGVQVLTWTGNTGSSITGFYVTGRTNGLIAWSSGAYVDDLCIDDTTGEADAAPPSPRFPFLLVNGAGAHTNWSVQGAASNYQAIDDSGAPNDAADYIWTTVAATKDSEAIADTVPGTTVPAGYSIEAVIWSAWAAKTNAGVASTLKLGARDSGGTENIGSAQSLATSFGPVFERQTTKPGGGAWAESDVDGAQIILESAGSFS